MSENLNDPPLPQLSPANRELEEALAALTPSSASISRDQLLYEAGRASVPQNGVRFWQGTTLVMIVAMLGALYFRSERIVDRPVEKIVRVVETKIEYAAAMPFVPRDDKPETPLPQVAFKNELPANCYLRIRNDLFEHGLTAIEGNTPIENQTPKRDDANQTIYQLRQKMEGAF